MLSKELRLKKIVVFSGILISLILSSCIEFYQPLSKASPNLRILLDKTDRMVIKPNYNYLLFFDGRKEVGRGNIYISSTSNGMMINGVIVNASELEIDPSGFFMYNGKQYRGNCKILYKDNRLVLLNIIDMESYLYSVVPSEMPAGWEYEALKAQAIVARTYALYEMVLAHQKNQEFDLYADTRSQVYKGMSSEDQYTTAAVDHTMGQVIKYQNRVIQSFFHSCSGGQTESAENVWGASFPYLQSVPSPYGKIKDNYKWEVSIRLDALQYKLGLAHPISNISVLSRSESKRIMEVEIMMTNQEKIVLTGKKLRETVGNVNMKSTRANLKIDLDNLSITGVGYGHGVGMGQWDAQGMAQEGYKYNLILSYFYKGTQIEKMW